MSSSRPIRTCAVACALAVALSPFSAGPSAGEETRVDSPLVRNGGFESGLTAPWGTGQYAAGRSSWWTLGNCQATAEADSRTARSGKQSLHVINRSSRAAQVYGTTQQPVPVEPGRTYRVTLWAKARNLASAGAVSVVVDEAWQIRPIQLPEGSYDWNEFTGTFALPDGAGQLRILSEDRGEVWIDDVTVVPVVRENPRRTVVPLPQLAAEVTVTERVTPERGATISLPDGARVEIPPQAVDVATDFTATRLKLTGPEARSSRAYDFRLGPDDVKLKSPATLLLPFDADGFPKDMKGARVRVAFWEGENGWRQVPAEIDTEKGFAVVKTDHFSTWLLSWTAYWFSHYRGTPVRLEVPYYPQGGAGWCWAASTQMLLKYYGKDVETWTIASTFGVDYETGLEGFDIMTGKYKAYLKGNGLQTEASLLGWIDPLEMTGYIMYHLKQGRPVWLALPNVEHVVLAVGFDKQGMYVNDPSGYLLEFLRGSAEVEEDHLNSALITWYEWFGPMIWRKAYTAFPAKQTLVVLDARPAKTPALTLTTLSEDLEIRIPQPRVVRAHFQGRFMWDGTRDLGYYFCGQQVGPFIGSPEYYPGNADSISKCIVTLSNSTERDVRATIHSLIDGVPLADKRTLPLRARTSCIPVDLVEGGLKGLRKYRLRPGPHDLRFALKVGDQVVDMSNIRLTVAPAQPSGLQAERTASEVALTWDENPETEWGLARISYVVWKDGKPLVQTTEPFWTDQVSGDDQEEHRYQVEAFVIGGQDLNSILTEQLRVAAPKTDALVGSILGDAQAGSLRPFPAWFSCPNLTLRLHETRIGSRSITGQCTGIATVRDDDQWVRFRTDLTTEKGYQGSSLVLEDSSIFAVLGGTVQIDHLDAGGKVLGSTRYSHASLTLEGTFHGTKADGDYSLSLRSLDPNDKVIRSGQQQFDDPYIWTGVWKAQMQ